MEARDEERLRALARAVEAAGASLTLELPGLEPLAIGKEPERAFVHFRRPADVAALLEGDHLALAEAWLDQRVEIRGELRQVLFVTDRLDLGPASRLRRALFWLRFAFGRRHWSRRSVAHHYDRPADFFLAWLDPRWRSYTHGFYRTPADDPSEAQARKLQFAIDALDLAPGMEVLDVGCGWGSFLEYAGARGIRVHGLTLSREQHAFVSERIRARGLPCGVELADFLDHRPERAFDGAVLMGSLEHLPDYRRVAQSLLRHLRPGAAVYADFVSSREGPLAGGFLRKHIFPGVSGYVEVPRLLSALLGAGFELRTLENDTRSCALTVRDWARALDAAHDALAARHGERAVRAFQLYLWSACHFLETGRTEAFHLVAAARGRGARSASAAAARQSAPNASPSLP